MCVSKFKCPPLRAPKNSSCSQKTNDFGTPNLETCQCHLPSTLMQLPAWCWSPAACRLPQAWHAAMRHAAMWHTQPGRKSDYRRLFQGPKPFVLIRGKGRLVKDFQRFKYFEGLKLEHCQELLHKKCWHCWHLNLWLHFDAFGDSAPLRVWVQTAAMKILEAVNLTRSRDQFLRLLEALPGCSQLI